MEKKKILLKPEFELYHEKLSAYGLNLIEEFKQQQNPDISYSSNTRILKFVSGEMWRNSDFAKIYQQVEYIQTDGNQYIDTGIKASDYQDGLECVFKGCCTGTNGSKTNNYLFGCLANGQRSGNISFMNNNLSTIFIGSNSEGTFSTNISLNTDFILQTKGTSKDVNGFIATYNHNSFYLKTSNVANSNMPSANIFLLACNINGSPSSSSSTGFTGKLYNFTVNDMNGTPLRNFNPCYRKADNVIGLYDAIEGVFYTNKGTGNFLKGANI